VSQQQKPIIQPNSLTKDQSQAVVVLGTPMATETARRDAVKTLHAALLTADPRASAKTMMDTTAKLVAALKHNDPTLSSGAAYVEMRAHLTRTGDFKPSRRKSSGNVSPGSGSAPSVKQPSAPSPQKQRKGFFRSLFRA